MHVIDCEQGSAKWLHARCGKPSGSNAFKIVTPTGKAVTGKARDTYMNELLYERLTGDSTQCFVNKAMERGNNLEPLARGWFEMETGLAVEQVGFCLHDCGKFGASPDGLIGIDSGLEIKTATGANHIGKLLDEKVPAENMVQIQACMWICNAQSWYYVLFDDNEYVPSEIIKVERDPAIIAGLALFVPMFCQELDDKHERIRARFKDVPIRDTIDVEELSGDWRPWTEESETFNK